MRKNGLVLIIHNVRSAHNVGALFRTADGAGVAKIFLTGYTPRPHDVIVGRVSGRRYQYTSLTKAEKELAKTALGAEKSMVWARVVSLKKILALLREEKYTVVGLEQSSKSMDYRKYVPSSGVALIVGNEVRGLDTRVLRECDATLEIPMRGQKNSLNVAVAAGIALYEIASTIENISE